MDNNELDENDIELVSDDDEIEIVDPEIIEEIPKPPKCSKPTLLELIEGLAEIQGCLDIKLRRELGRRPKLADRWTQSSQVVCRKCGWLISVHEETRAWRCGRCNITVEVVRLRPVFFIARHLYKKR